MNLEPVHERIAAQLSARRPVMVGLDGRSGSGKTTLAQQLRHELEAGGHTVSVVHLEELYPGWDGLAATPALARKWVLEPLRVGAPARFRRWDWNRDEFADEWWPVPAADVVVVEGVGALSPDLRPYLDVSIWLSLDAAERYERAMRRDGDLYRPHWQRWAAQEDEYLREENPAGFADLIIAG